MSELLESGRTNLNLRAVGHGRHPPSSLLAAVREAAGSDFQVHGEVGREDQGRVVYLATDVESGRLVAFALAPGGAGEFSCCEAVRGPCHGGAVEGQGVT